MTTHWADLAVNFKIQDASCLMAGVSPPKELVAWADQMPPEARYIFERLWNAYMQGAGVYKQPALDSPDFPKMLHAPNFMVPMIGFPPRGAIRHAKGLAALNPELVRKRLERVRVSRAELHRWVQAVGINSAYSFGPPQATGQTASDTRTVQDGRVVEVPQAAPPGWKAMAERRAAEIIANDKKKDLYPSQENIADTIAKEFRAAGVVGAGGKPMTGAYIKRHALKGISSEQGKQLSTAKRRGK
jgi:hypothetical protein